MNPIHDLTGMVFGRLTVVSPAPRDSRRRGAARWKCRCSCGNEVNVSAANLQQGHSQSCGCKAKDGYINLVNDIVGRRFGRLSVVGFSRLHGGRSLWFCKCDCGNEVEMIGNYMTSGKVKSCGCLNHEPKKILPTGQSAFNNLYYRYKERARIASLMFSLDEGLFRELTSGDCYYCGKPPARLHKGKGWNGGYRYNGVDRVDNSVGYIPTNCVSCCRECNSAKNSVTVNMIEKAYKFLHP